MRVVSSVAGFTVTSGAPGVWILNGVDATGERGDFSPTVAYGADIGRSRYWNALFTYSATIYSLTQKILGTNEALQLTAGTMTMSGSGVNGIPRIATAKASWTNAMVVALGANATGDITVATLPAKHKVIDVAVVIDTACQHADTLTISVGRTDTDYIDYIVASNAKAAANTVYGDASAERGTNLTGYDLPSYTATTAIKAHFVAGSGHLDDVTTCTGHVTITTQLEP
jgi:hypothetical protein